MAQDLARKLQLQPGQRLEVLGPPDALAAVLAEVGSDRDAFAVGVLAFAAHAADVAAYADSLAAAAGAPDGLAWAAYPKRASGVETDLTRDRGWEALAEAGLRPVRQISIDETWSALRFRRTDHVNADG